MLFAPAEVHGRYICVQNVTQPFFYYPINETYVYGGSLTLNMRIPNRIKVWKPTGVKLHFLFNLEKRFFKHFCSQTGCDEVSDTLCKLVHAHT